VIRDQEEGIPLRTGGFRYPRVELLEASIVSIPALASALRIDEPAGVG
jgi:hypothetical protein